jgi:Lysyl oxidase
MIRRLTSGRRRTAVLTVVAATTLAGAAGVVAPPAAASSASPLVLITPRSTSMYAYRGHAYGDLEVMLKNPGPAFEIWSHRPGYASPISTSWLHGTHVTTLPRGTMKNFRGLTKFFDVTIRNAAGATVVHRTRTACLDGESARVVPSGAAHSPYPLGCPDNPWTLGSVQGIAAGWATSLPLLGFGPLKLTHGTYRMHVAIVRKFHDMFGIANNDAEGTVILHVRKNGVGGPQETTHATTASPDVRHRTGTPLDAPPPNGPEPDLAALPPWGIDISKSGNFLQFSATVWNGGTSPLLVEGFRENHKPIMDAYQYFFDTDGNQVGYVPAGHMEWDPRPTHHHWHFEDFARYRLLRVDQTKVQRSHKEAFCLANTDAIDYTVPGADWTPDDTDLQTSCGGFSAPAVSEVLAAGSGDTYEQFRGGQAFSLFKVPNGTYYISVEANPDHILTESSTDNNIALRKIRIGGTPGHRTVQVFPVGNISA